MKPTNHYSAMLYALADEICKEDGCTTQSAEEVEEAAERLDTLTITIRGMEIERSDMLSALEKFIQWNKRYPSSRIFSHSEILAIAKELDLIATEAEEAVAKAKAFSCGAQAETAKIDPASLLPDERECCGTFPRTPHRSTCAKYRGKKGGAA